ncbi:DUF3579 domain-containing protein [Acidithiobacillus ferrooxidans]|uniref:DUF3579 domain-containing protein n=2 Tax=Acidithiobacillus ferrooxidans TaxID=920 RepID=UPI0027D90181|nr:DUF3579 domain-containing protein [Acidithiobacillus ferrooxidans]
MADMDNGINKAMWIVIYGITSDGVKFRPSSWAEMLIEGVGLTTFGRDQKNRKSPGSARQWKPSGR